MSKGFDAGQSAVDDLKCTYGIENVMVEAVEVIKVIKVVIVVVVS